MKSRFISLFSLFILALPWGSTPSQADTSDALTQRLAMRLLGQKLNPDDPKTKFYYAAVKELVEQGSASNAALLLTSHPNFAGETLRYLATATSRTLGETDRLDQLTAYEALFIGAAMQDWDIRDAWKTNGFFVIKDEKCVADPNPYDCARKKKLNLASPEVLAFSARTQDDKDNALPSNQSAGLWTAVGQQDFDAGTNRRTMQRFIQNEYCLPLDYIRATRAANLDNFVRRDVERNTETYASKCATCHRFLDPVTSAFSHVDFSGSSTSVFQNMVYSSGIQLKMNKNADVFPQGSVVTSDAWTLEWTPSQISDLEYEGPLSGSGINSLASSLMEAGQWRRCFAQRVAKIVCPNVTFTKDQLSVLGSNFKANKYNLRRLFADVATQPQCLGQ